MSLIPGQASDEELFDGAGASASAPVIERLVAMCKECAELEETIESLNEALKANSGRYHHLKTKALVELMAEAQVPEFTHLDPMSNLPGVKVKIADFVSGSLPKEEYDREIAIQKLVEAGGEKLLTATITMDFPKSLRDKALALFGELFKQWDTEADVEFKEGVHAATLQAFVREKLRKGEEVPFEELGIHVGKVAKITPIGKDGKRLRKSTSATEE